MHTHTPTHNLWFWSKRPLLAFSVAEMSMAEMSGPKRPRPKCPWPKCPTFTIVGILTFISMINTTSEKIICLYFSFYEQLKFRAQLS